MSHRSWYRSRKITPIANYMRIRLYRSFSFSLAKTAVDVDSRAHLHPQECLHTTDRLKATRIETVELIFALFHFQVSLHKFSTTQLCLLLSVCCLLLFNFLFLCCCCFFFLHFFPMRFLSLANRIFLSSAIIDGNVNVVWSTTQYLGIKMLGR